MSDELPDAQALGRRSFLERMGAGLAAAGLGGCLGRDPPEQIVPYARQPEYVVPGVPLLFASAFALDGHAYGILVETHEGRPTKIEGQRAHHASLGATCAFAQASVRALYDVARAGGVRQHGQASSWPAFLRAARSQLEAGKRVAVLTPHTTSRMLSEALGRLQVRHPRLRWHRWSPVSYAAAEAGCLQLFGARLSCHLHIERARVVLSLDDDFLTWSPGRLRHARALAFRRRPELGDEALRLYVLESFPTITGASADHRRAVRVTEVARLARMLLAGLMGEPLEGDPWLAAAVADLRRAGSAGLVVAGAQQPAAVHALAHAANHVLGAAGETIVYTERLERQPAGELASLPVLVAAIDRGEVDALLILDGNPAYDAPADLDFAGRLATVPFTAHLADADNETGERCEWRLPLTHPLEAWADFRSDDGGVTLSQPTIRPLHGGLTAAEVLTALAEDTTEGRDLLERTWADMAPDDARWWRSAIHDGQLPNSSAAPVVTRVEAAVLAELIKGETAPENNNHHNNNSSGLVLGFRPDPAAWDGRFSGDPWLQELPRPITGLVWGNAAYIAPETARERELAHEEIVRLELDGRTVEAPLYVLDGHPPGQVTLHLGYGRRVGAGVGLGVDAYPLRTSDGLWAASGLVLKKSEAAGRRGRLIIDRHRTGDDAEGQHYARWTTRSAYRHGGQPDAPEHRPPSLHPTRPLDHAAWAMTIDLTACIGCGACVLACQAENNIPTVGAAEAARGRIMHWIRIDTYAGEGHGPRWRFQPVPCMQCEHAPCELVCPTGATQHSHDGLNDMVYNRCVGTRYCSNNCPYKVRRFNFFDYVERDLVALRLQRNPDVTVRTRGVMEKCTYCVQRIRGAESAAKREGRAFAEVVTACQAVCPGGAIDFGDLTRPGASVVARRREARAYALLHELGARPRTSYLAQLHNPSPALGDDDEVG